MTPDQLFYILCRKGHVFINDPESGRQVKTMFEEMFPEQAVTYETENKLVFANFKIDNETRI